MGNKTFHSIWLLHVVVGDGGGGLSSVCNVFTDITLFVNDYIWSHGHWLLIPTSQ